MEKVKDKIWISDNLQYYVETFVTQQTGTSRKVSSVREDDTLRDSADSVITLREDG